MLDVKVNESMTDRIIKAWRKFRSSSSREEILNVYAAAKFGEKPTHRAIQEHIKKLKTGTSVTASPKTNVGAGGFPSTAPSTPRKTASRTPRKNTGTGSHRKRKACDDGDDDEEPYLGRKEVKDLTGSPTPGADATERSPRKRRAASRRVSELIKQIYETESDDEDEDPGSKSSKLGSVAEEDSEDGYVDAEELIEDAENVTADVVGEAFKDTENLVEEDTKEHTINIKSEPELEV